jgi:hypothetical protein
MQDYKMWIAKMSENVNQVYEYAKASVIIW